LRSIEVGADRLACGVRDTVGPSCIEADRGEATRGRTHPGAWPGGDGINGEMAGVKVGCVRTSGFELDEESASAAEAVALGAVRVEIDAGGRSRIEAAAGAATCIASACAEAKAAGCAPASSSRIPSDRMPIGIIPLPGRQRCSSCSETNGLIARRLRAEDSFSRRPAHRRSQSGVASMVPSWTGTGPDGGPHPDALRRDERALRKVPGCDNRGA
jgi:hypothetical protein